MFKIRIEKSVVKYLEKINDPFYSKIKLAILKLAKDPRPHGYKQLKGTDAYRIRVGDYRIIYNIFDDILTIEIIDLGHRKNIYN